jgi:DNA-directed RNA polymerase specialized sigma24 family protein
MSPLTLRRYRAERLLRQDFDGLRRETLATVRARLRARGVTLDASDLDACYSQAWQGLYAAMVGGEAIASSRGWLVLVTFRRALDEHRTRDREHVGGDERGLWVTGGDGVRGGGAAGAGIAGWAGIAGGDVEGNGFRPASARARACDVPAERDIADELDDRRRLRQLFEGLRGRLSPRECEAAALCYLQGLSRAEAAARMGIGEARMRKLMEGPGAGRPGVAGKVGALLDTISGGGWCEEQGSTMRGLAFGILDPSGERYRLALAHQRECPACTRYVLCLRGLAAALPPIALPWALVGAGGAAAGAGASAGVSAGAGSGAGTGAVASAGTGAGASAGTGTGVATGAGASSLFPSGVAGVGGAAGGAAGGGWLLAGGSVGAKLAVGCLLALSVGCVALATGPLTLPRPAHEHRRRHRSAAAAEAQRGPGGYASASGLTTTLSDTAGTGHARAQQRSLEPARSAASEREASTPAAHAAREFGLEQPSSYAATPAAIASSPATAQSASVTQHALSMSQGSSSSRTAPATGSSHPSSGGGSAAAREFGIG